MDPPFYHDPITTIYCAVKDFLPQYIGPTIMALVNWLRPRLRQVTS